MAPHLLTIPLELRDEILKYVLLNHRCAPSTPEEIKKQNREVFSDVPLKCRQSACILYSAEPAEYTPTAVSLLLINRQLNAEVRSTLSRLPGGGKNYDLDIQLVRNRYLAPTWTRIIQLSTEVNTVHVSFQTCGIPADNTGMTLWRTNYYSQHPMVICLLYSMLERFLQVGAVSRRTNDRQRSISIRTLELDFVDQEGVEKPAENIHETDWLWKRWGRYQFNDIGIIHPAWICKLVGDEIQKLLYFGTREARFATILYQRIGSIVLKVNGTVQREFAIGQILGEMIYNPSLSSDSMLQIKVSKWIRWKSDAVEKRKRSNLDHKALEDGWMDEVKQQAYPNKCGIDGARERARVGANSHNHVYRHILPKPE